MQNFLRAPLFSYILATTLFASILITAVGAQSTGPSDLDLPRCPTFAGTAAEPIFDNVRQPNDALCRPDQLIARIPDNPDLDSAYLILDMGFGNEIVDADGFDFVFYERPSDQGILLDLTKIGVGATKALNTFQTVFLWGDDSPNNNGSVSPSHLWTDRRVAEKPEEFIPGNELYHNQGVQIDIGRNDGAKYRYVLVTWPTPPPGYQLPADPYVEIDAIESLHPGVDSTATAGAIQTVTAIAAQSATSIAQTSTANTQLTATAGAQLTSTADAQLTATADAQLTSTIGAELTATAGAELTATAEMATATVSAALTATAAATPPPTSTDTTIPTITSTLTISTTATVVDAPTIVATVDETEATLQTSVAETQIAAIEAGTDIALAQTAELVFASETAQVATIQALGTIQAGMTATTEARLEATRQAALTQTADAGRTQAADAERTQAADAERTQAAQASISPAAGNNPPINTAPAATNTAQASISGIPTVGPTFVPIVSLTPSATRTPVGTWTPTATWTPEPTHAREPTTAPEPPLNPGPAQTAISKTQTATARDAGNAALKTEMAINQQTGHALSATQTALASTRAAGDATATQINTPENTQTALMIWQTVAAIMHTNAALDQTSGALHKTSLTITQTIQAIQKTLQSEGGLVAPTIGTPTATSTSEGTDSSSSPPISSFNYIQSLNKLREDWRDPNNIISEAIIVAAGLLIQFLNFRLIRHLHKKIRSDILNDARKHLGTRLRLQPTTLKRIYARTRLYISIATLVGCILGLGALFFSPIDISTTSVVISVGLGAALILGWQNIVTYLGLPLIWLNFASDGDLNSLRVWKNHDSQYLAQHLQKLRYYDDTKQARRFIFSYKELEEQFSSWPNPGWIYHELREEVYGKVNTELAAMARRSIQRWRQRLGI